MSHSHLVSCFSHSSSTCFNIRSNQEYWKFRIIRQELFCKKIVLKNFQKLTGKHICPSIFIEEFFKKTCFHKSPLWLCAKLRVSRAFVPYVPHVPACRKCLRASPVYVPLGCACFCAIVSYVPYQPSFLGAFICFYAPYGPSLFSRVTCFHFLFPCLHLLAYILFTYFRFSYMSWYFLRAFIFVNCFKFFTYLTWFLDALHCFIFPHMLNKGGKGSTDWFFIFLDPYWGH